jgi:DNA polymerase
MSRLDPSLARECEAALAWWHMAGVDHDFADDATAWLGERASPAPGQAVAAGQASAARAATGDRRPAADRPIRHSAPLPETPPAPAAPRRNPLGDSPPTDLAAFRQWWMESPEAGLSPGALRVPPRGAAGAALMVLVPQPEQGDREVLLSGPQGRLLANILAAMGLEESAVYIAAALPSVMPMADFAALAAGGMDMVTAHHVGLVAPARVLAFGTGLAPMLGFVNRDDSSRNNHGNVNRPVIMSETLEALMESPRLKARFWRRWIEWSATQ